jgi:hypothetical protein
LKESIEDIIINIGIESNGWESGDSVLKAATVQRTLHVTEMGSSVDSADEALELSSVFGVRTAEINQSYI